MVRRRKLEGYVLLIDHAPYVEDTRDYLLEKGYGVIQSQTLEAVVSLVNAIIPDIILIHHIPQRLDTRAICSVIRELPHIQTTPILVWVSVEDSTIDNYNWVELVVNTVIRTKNLDELTGLVRQSLYTAR
jgi:DNA-binding response OmpR family regulator